MDTIHLSGLDNPEIKVKDDEKPKFPFDTFQPYFRICYAGSSGGGKSNAMINLYEKMYPYFDKTYVVSPTIHNDPKQKAAFMDRDNVMIFDEATNQLINEIWGDAKRIHDQYTASIKVKKAWDKWKKNGWDEKKLTGKEMALLDSIQWDRENLQWDKNRRPSLCLILDDLQATPVLRGKALEAFVIKARHFNTNIIMTAQTWKGVSPNIRRNLSGYCIFFTPDMSLLKGIYEEVAGMFKGFDDFMETYNFATQDGRHNFLYVDVADKKHGIRKNYNEVIVRK